MKGQHVCRQHQQPKDLEQIIPGSVQVQVRPEFGILERKIPKFDGKLHWIMSK